MKGRQDSTSKKKLAAAFIAGAGTALVAGSYLLYGPKISHGDVERFKDEIMDDLLDRIAQLKSLTKQAYDRIVDEAVVDYAQLRELSEDQVAQLAVKLKANYKKMAALAKEAAEEAEDDY